MIKCGEDGKPINRNWIPLMISRDQNEDTPIQIFLTALQNDAPPVSEAEAYVETIVHLASKRALLEAMDKARNEIMEIDIGVPAEHMKDVGIRMISNAFNSEADDDMMEYAEWGKRVAERSRERLSHNDEEHTYGLSPGLSSVYKVIGNLLPGKLYVLGGMSSSGKSALVRQIAEAAARDAMLKNLGHGYIASLEMTGEEYATRHLAQMLGIPADKIEQGALNQTSVEHMMSYAAKMRGLPIFVDQRVRMTLEHIRARALKVKNTKGLAFMVIDHLLLIKGGKQDSLSDRVADGTIEGKNMAKEFGVPVIMLAQLDEKRLLENNKYGNILPNSTHLFGGQTINQNADHVFFVHRPEVVLAKNEPAQNAHGKEGEESPWAKWRSRMDAEKGKALVYNNKRRGGQSAVREELLFDGPTMAFGDI